MTAWYGLFIFATVLWLLTARLREWHHFWLGAFAVLFGWAFGLAFVVKIGALVCLDDGVQHTIEQVTGRPVSLLRWVYQHSVGRIPWVARLNAWLDRLAGKR